MTQSTPPLEALPTGRAAGCPFDPPAGLADVRAEAPLTRMTFPDGHQGWLATGYAVIRAVLADRRFSSRHEIGHAPVPGPYADQKFPPAPPGDFIAMDPPDHTRYRRLLTGKFTVRRMRLLTERVEQVTAERLDLMAAHGSPADLVSQFAQPVPSLMICELLGVPADDREAFQDAAIATNNHELGPEQQWEAFSLIQRTLGELVRAKRVEHTDDLLGDLVNDPAAADLTDEEFSNMGALVFGAGLETTANMIALGTFALLTHPEQLAALRADAERTDAAVEELLRYLSIAHTGVRTALEDVELAGRTVRAGETVAISIQAANRDPARFADPDTLDLDRRATGHLSFGHGIHQCLGQQLARVELRVALPALLRRFPDLRLAVPAEEVSRRDNADVYGLNALPVAWGEA